MLANNGRNLTADTLLVVLTPEVLPLKYGLGLVVFLKCDIGSKESL